jgi:hypothetical protein
MTIYFSLTTNSFYDTELGYSSYPDDIIEIPREEYLTALTEMYQNNKVANVNNGNLELIDAVPVITWEGIRRKRNRLLEKSDYTQMPDCPGDKTAWAVYRQTLRDLPQTYSSPDEVVWPTAPGED